MGEEHYIAGEVVVLFHRTVTDVNDRAIHNDKIALKAMLSHPD